MNIYERVSKLESFIFYHQANEMETLRKAYLSACEKKDKEEASFQLRLIRNRLLEESDSEMAIDRLNLKPNNLQFSFDNILNSKWAIYRQELRDLPQQLGFPFEVRMPIKPIEK